MEFIKIGIFVIILVMMAGFLKGQKGNFSLVISLAGVLFIGMITLSSLADLFVRFAGIESMFQLDSTYLSLLIKLVGITYVCEFASQVCMEAGYGNLANQITLFGKVAICGFAMPLIAELFQTMGAI